MSIFIVRNKNKQRISSAHNYCEGGHNTATPAFTKSIVFCTKKLENATFNEMDNICCKDKFN